MGVTTAYKRAPATTQELRDLAARLWWYIENVPEDAPDRTDQFFAVRERCRDLLQRGGDAPKPKRGKPRSERLEEVLSAAEAVAHQLTHGEASEGDLRDIRRCARELNEALRPLRRRNVR